MSVRGLPEVLEVGAGTALRLDGGLDPGLLPLTGLRIRIGTIEREVDGYGLADSDGVEELLWWSVLPVAEGFPTGTVEVELLADRKTGTIGVPLGMIRVVAGREVPAPPAESPPAAGLEPLVAICMATYEPRSEWLLRQLESIRAQSWKRWVCVISDDASSPEAFASLERAVEGDRRFTVSRSDERLGFYANFERALRMAPVDAELIALCDQDDRWHPDKLDALAAELAAHPGAELAYSDMRVVDEQGELLSDTFWYLHSNRCDDIASLLITNTVTGAASLFRRRLLDIALPFPPGGTVEHYHDQWLAFCALALGEIAYLDRPTYDYTRHGQSVTVTGASEWYAPPSGLRERVQLRWRQLTRRLRIAAAGPGWREIYFERVLMIRQYVAAIDARAGARIAPDKRRPLALLTTVDRSPRAVAWLAARALRPLIGRAETQTRERVLLSALIWRAIVARRARSQITPAESSASRPVPPGPATRWKQDRWAPARGLRPLLGRRARPRPPSRRARRGWRT